MGLRYPNHCKASHIKMVYAGEPEWTPETPETIYSEREKFSIARTAAWETGDDRGYFAMQSTKLWLSSQRQKCAERENQPATLAFALQDSPVALLAWIYDKLCAWTDSYDWHADCVLTWVSIYRFSTAGPSASIYIYYGAMHDQKIILDTRNNTTMFDLESQISLWKSSWRQRVGERSWVPS